MGCDVPSSPILTVILILTAALFLPVKTNGITESFAELFHPILELASHSQGLGLLDDVAVHDQPAVTQADLEEQLIYGRALPQTVEVELGKEQLTSNMSSFAYPFSCNSKDIVIQANGIYQFENYYTNTSGPKLVRLDNDWHVGGGDKILDVIHWEGKCFIAMSNHNGTFSYIYTLHGDNLSPTLRQKIKNDGFVTSAKFFTIKKNLFLIITNDNTVHSLTVCPLLRWAGTYMDQIHAIQTRGAVAVETFKINSKEYIAIAQSQDASGNYEVGTQILRMDAGENLEKVQLLWSHNPVALKYFQVEGEHYLLIGQAKEPSVTYSFAGVDFVPTQALKNYHGPKLFMDVEDIDKNAVILAAQSSGGRFYTWSRAISSSSLISSNSSRIVVNYPVQIMFAKFFRSYSNDLFLVLILTSRNGSPVLKLYPVRTNRKEIAESQVAEPENKLASCLSDVRSRLHEDEQLLPGIKREMQNILKTDGDHRFDGSIRVEAPVKINSNKTSIAYIDVTPRGFENEGHLPTPTQILDKISAQSQLLQENVLTEIPNLLMSNKPGIINGSYEFVTLEVKQLKAPRTDMQLAFINGRLLDDIDVYALRKDNMHEIVTVSGEWTISKLSSEEVELSLGISGIHVEDFLLKNCPGKEEAEAQDLSGDVVFKNDLIINQGVLIPANATINGIIVADIVLRNGPVTNVQGYKHFQNVIGGDRFVFGSLNSKNFSVWYDSVLHKDGPSQYSTGTKTFTALKGDKIGDLSPNTVNGNSWEEFLEGVLRNGGDQVIERDLHFRRLDVDSVTADAIGAVKFPDLFSTNGFNQHIDSNIVVKTLTVYKNLVTETVNGIDQLLSKAVTKNENAELVGPVILEGFTVTGNVTVLDGVTVSGKDISEIAKERRKQTYYSSRKKPTVFKSPVITENLNATSINGHKLDKIHENFWSKSKNNKINGPLDLRGRKVKITNGMSTDTVNGYNLATDIISSSDPYDQILANIEFVGPVTVHGDVRQQNGMTMNGEDLSALMEKVVHAGDGKTIAGRKLFKSLVTVEYGADFESVNGVRLPEHLVKLKTTENQQLSGIKQFKKYSTIANLAESPEMDVTGKVNGVDLKDLWNSTAFRDYPNTVHGKVQFNQTASANNLFVRGYLNGLNVSEVLTNAIYLDQEQHLNFTIILTNGNVEVEGPAAVKTVNGINIDAYLYKVVSKHGTRTCQIIQGTKTFTNIVVDGNLSCDSLNGISLKNLSDEALSLAQPQNVSGKYTTDSLTLEGGVEAGSIGGIDTKDLVFIDDEYACSVNSDLTFLKDVNVDGPLTVGLLNGHIIKNLTDPDEKPNNREFAEIIVDGNLNWQHNREDIEGISQFLEHIVTFDTDQNITAEVVFAQGFSAEYLKAKPWIDNVDLDAILDDSITESTNPLHLEGNNTFLKGITLHSTIATEKLAVKMVSGFNMVDLNDLVVRKYSNRTVYGTKIFPNGLSTSDFVFKDLNGKGDFSWLVRNGDNRTIDQIKFVDLDVQGNLDYTHSKGFDLKPILSNRITRDGDQTLTANFTVSSLRIQNNCNPRRINGLNISDIYLKNETGDQIIHGKKVFRGDVTIKGELRSRSVNGYDFNALNKDVYRKSGKEHIRRPIVFLDPVELGKDLEVKKDVNNHRIEDLQHKMAKTIQGISDRALDEPESLPSPEKLTHIESMKDKLPPPPIWLEYLRFRQNWSVVGPQSRVEYVELAPDGGGITALHNLENDYNNPGCVCNTVNAVDVDGPKVSADPLNSYKCQNAFFVFSEKFPTTLMYSIVDNSESYNTSCTNRDDVSPVLSISAGKIKLAVEPSKGFLSDAKSFYSGGQEYIVLSYFFDSKTLSHDSFTYIYQVGNGSLALLQKIPSSGPVRLALVSLRNTWFLAIANNRNPKDDSCRTSSAIYKWSRTSKRFALVREVATNGAVDVIFIQAEDRVRRGDIRLFAAFAQTGISGTGEVLILQYNPRKHTFVTIQTLRTQWSVTGIESFTIHPNAYLVTVVPQEGLHIYEYRFVEGFKEYLFVPLVGAQDIASIVWGIHRERLLFVVASSKTTILAEAVIAGSGGTPLTLNQTRLDREFERLPFTLQFRSGKGYKHAII